MPTHPFTSSTGTLHDPVYGDVHFTDPLLTELLHTDAVQRLREIYQGGITAFIRPERNTTRLDHSLGVAALLRRLKADVEEQAAGLIHDVPHTAFSHVIDFVFPNQAHTYHEDQSEEIFRKSEIPDILQRHGLDWRRVAEPEHYPLLEQPLPHLCADRLDYFLRDGILDLHTFTAEEGRELLDHLKIWNDRIVVDDVDAARWLGDMFMTLDDRCWCSIQEVGWYAVMARALREALRHGIITLDDFEGTDAALLKRLRSSEVPSIQRWLSLLDRSTDFVRDPDDYNLIALPKVRAIDPPVQINGQAVPLSALDDAFSRRRRGYIAAKTGQWYLRIVGLSTASWSGA
jgi:hypothetical protein